MTKRESQKTDYEAEAKPMLTPQLENAYSRAGILFGLLNASIKSGYLVMVKDTEDIEYKYHLDWMAFSNFMSLDILGKTGVSLTAIASSIVEHWELRVKQLRERNDGPT